MGLTIHFTLRKYTDEIKADFTKEPEQINIDIENLNYSDEKSGMTEELSITEELKPTDIPTDEDIKDVENEEAVKKYNEVINMLGDFEDEE